MIHSRLFKKILFIGLGLVLGITIQAQIKAPYQLFDQKGKSISHDKMMKMLSKADMILFGELHNNAISHWLQYEVTKDLVSQRSVILGAEMFEADNQEALNKFLSGEIDDKQLAEQARLWPNYKTDYAPLVDIAKQNNLKFIATNIPRRYASKVFKGGFEALDTISDLEKSWIAPLPIDYDAELPGYKNMLTMMGDMGHASDNFPKAQAIKDATMGYFILNNYAKGSLFIHYNGSYHSDNFEGILWYLQRKMPELNYLTISTVTQTDIKKLDKENIGKSNFIICVDENMTNTY